MSPRLRSRLITFPAIFVFAAVVAIICGAITAIHTEFAWKAASFLSVLSVFVAPDLAMHVMGWISGVPATRWDAIAATVVSLAAVPVLAWVFPHSARLISNTTLPESYMGLLRFICFMYVIGGGIAAMRLTKRCSEPLPGVHSHFR